MLRRSAPDSWGGEAPPGEAPRVGDPRAPRPWRMHLRPPIDVGTATDRGRVRPHNEDSFAVLPVGDSCDELLMAVADGLGGARGGEVASRLAVEALGAAMTRPRNGRESPASALRRGFERAESAVRRVAHEQVELEGLGTTLTAALVRWPHVWLAHAGDSRAYLWRAGSLHRLTRDHTMAERMREEGLLSPGEPIARLESMLWNAVGGSSEGLEVDQARSRLELGDALLLCSDGLTRHVSDDELARRLARDAPAAELCDGLVRAANAAGGEDNVTVVLARVGTPPPS